MDDEVGLYSKETRTAFYRALMVLLVVLMDAGYMLLELVGGSEGLGAAFEGALVCAYSQMSFLMKFKMLFKFVSFIAS